MKGPTATRVNIASNLFAALHKKHLNSLNPFYIVHCNIDFREAIMADALKKKTGRVAAAITVAVEPGKPGKKAVAATAVKPAVKIETPTIVAETKAVTPAQGTNVMNDTVKNVEATVKEVTAETTAKATEMFKDMTTRAKSAMEKTSEIAKEAVEFNKANLEAVVEAGKIAVKGAQTVGQNTAELTRKNFEATTAMLKSAAAVKSPTDFFKLQGDFARSQFDGAVAEMSKSTEFYMKLAGEMFQPIQSRYTVAAEQVKARMAA
jgi:phasin family protein